MASDFPMKNAPAVIVRFGVSELRLWMSSFQDGKLLPKGQVLKEQVAARTKRVRNQKEQRTHQMQDKNHL